MLNKIVKVFSILGILLLVFLFIILQLDFGIEMIIFVIIIIIEDFKIARECDDKFGKYLCFGIIFGLAFQAVLNLMVVVGLIPVTVVTLPFLSYGGSSLLITLCSIGIVLNISRNN